MDGREFTIQNSGIQKAKQMIHKPRLGFMNLTLNTDEFKSKAKWFVHWASNLN